MPPTLLATVDALLLVLTALLPRTAGSVLRYTIPEELPVGHVIADRPRPSRADPADLTDPGEVLNGPIRPIQHYWLGGSRRSNRSRSTEPADLTDPTDPALLARPIPPIQPIQRKTAASSRAADAAGVTRDRSLRDRDDED